MAEKNFTLPDGVRPIMISKPNFELLLREGRSFEEYFRFEEAKDVETTESDVISAAEKIPVEASEEVKEENPEENPEENSEESSEESPEESPEEIPKQPNRKPNPNLNPNPRNKRYGQDTLGRR